MGYFIFGGGVLQVILCFHPLNGTLHNRMVLSTPEWYPPIVVVLGFVAVHSGRASAHW
jgi:hypothetical protein